MGNLVDSFVRKFGFERSDVTLDNWKDYPYSKWSFQHVSELIPVAEIEGESSALPRTIAADFLDTEVGELNSNTVRGFLENSYTDAFVVLHKGKVISEFYANGMTARTPHLIFSVSKSVAGLLTGTVASKFGLLPDALVSSYIPEAQESAYADCTVRDLLDMLVSVDFDETYASKEGVYARYRRSMLWMPATPEEPFASEDLASCVLSLPKGKDEHGKTFLYRSPNTDLLGLVLERVSGIRYPDLLSKLLWRPIGAGPATITVDNLGASRAAGGISCTVDDLCLLGELIIHRGRANGTHVVPENWIADTINGGDAKAWKAGDFARLLPQGKYRNQWYAMGDGSVCAIGIHGQWIYVNPKNEIVIVRMSSQPLADDDGLDTQTLNLFAALTQELA